MHHREIVYTEYQYPFAINLNDLISYVNDEPSLITQKIEIGEIEKDKDAYKENLGGHNRFEWLKLLLDAIVELAGVAGNQARSFFPMNPKSIVVRLTGKLVPEFDTYGFRSIAEIRKIKTYSNLAKF